MAGRKKPLEQLPVLLGALTALIGAVTALILAWHSLFPSPVPSRSRDPVSQVSSRGSPEAAESRPQADNHAETFLRPIEASQPTVASVPQPSSNVGATHRARDIQSRGRGPATAAGVESRPEQNWRRAVVSSARIEIYLRQRPSDDAPALRRVTPKDVLHITGPEDGWWLAQLPSGERGYVKDDDFITVISE
jgi:hypothetical protein